MGLNAELEVQKNKVEDALTVQKRVYEDEKSSLQA